QLNDVAGEKKKAVSNDVETAFKIMDRIGSGWLELHGETADDAFRRTNHEQLVVHRLVGYSVSEEVPHGDEHLPLRAAEIQERQRLAHLHVEPCVERLPLGARERVAHPVQEHHVRGGLWH